MTKRPPAMNVPMDRLVPGQEYRVLSVHPPWAWSIIFAGKDVENRSWETPYRGPVLIHASSHRASAGELPMIRSEIAASSGMALASIPTDFPRSAIIGIVDLVDIVERARSKWAFAGELHWIVRNPRALETPVQDVSGKLKLWRWTAPASGRSVGPKAEVTESRAAASAFGVSAEAESAAEEDGAKQRGRSIDDVDGAEVIAALQTLATSTPVNDVDLLRSVSRKLGFARMGARVEAGLRAHLRRAVRSGVLVREGKMLRRVS